MVHHRLMDKLRVFEIANELHIDTNTAIAFLTKRGAQQLKPTDMIDRAMADGLREAMRKHQPRAARGGKIEADRSRSRRSPLTQQLREQHTDAVRNLIPTMSSKLRSLVAPSESGEIVVAFHDSDAARPYGFCTLSGQAWTPAGISRPDLAAVIEPLRNLYPQYAKRGWTPPKIFIAFDVAKQEAWHGRSLAAVQHGAKGDHLRADTLERVPPPSEKQPPRLATKAQRFMPAHVPALVSAISERDDRPEEAFLLHEELLRLAVDTLADDDEIEPLPVHINALWIFARPVIMQRPDGSDRHVRAIWFRQGEAMWRIRTYAAGTGNGGVPKEVGQQLSGRKPFVPTWDETRPERKVLAAVWALMTQGDVAESARVPSEGIVLRAHDGQGDGQLVVVRVKAGTSHALKYRGDESGNAAIRDAWSVRGHWRRQPYPSLGTDLQGKIVTRPIWIASYTKGDASNERTVDKVIVVRP